MMAWPDYGIGAVFTLIGLFFILAPKTRDAWFPGRLQGEVPRLIFSWAFFLFSLFWTIFVATLP
jgi:membrane associated rhomboid family serine protease